jgi:glycosyltransferase involved in cell wall biosynthesis
MPPGSFFREAMVTQPAEPAVSVVMIFLNGERFIQEAIESIVTQTYTKWELMLVDDGSTDGSTQIAHSYVEKYPGQVTYLEHEKHQNRGMSASRNLGILHCKGRYVAFLDSDDVWLPHKLERQVAIMESQPRASMIYGASRYWHSWTGAHDDFNLDFVPDPGVQTEVLFDPPALLTRLYPFGPATTPPPSDFLVRREALKAVGGFEEDFRGVNQLYDDQAFLVKMYLSQPIFVSSEEWDLYRIHPDSCDAVATGGGHYDAIRAFFLQWFESYLLKKGISDPDTWSAFQKAVQAAQIQLRTDGGSAAELVELPDEPGWVRIAIEKMATVTSSDIQLNIPFYKLQEHHRYVLRFQAKADNPRSLHFGLAEAHPPWTSLGLYQRMDLTQEWQRFEVEFVATADDDNARIHFDLGAAAFSVELSSPCLRHLSSGQLVEPSLLPSVPTLLRQRLRS